MLEVLNYAKDENDNLKIKTMLLLEKAALPIQLDLDAIIFAPGLMSRFFGVGHLNDDSQNQKSDDDTELHAMKGSHRN